MLRYVVELRLKFLEFEMGSNIKIHFGMFTTEIDMELSFGLK